MNVWSQKRAHENARRLLHIPAEHLTAQQQKDLANHLGACQECRSYAENVHALQPALARAMHIHWDNQNPPVTSSRSVQKRWKKVHMKQQVFRASAFLAAVAAVVFVVILSPGLLNSLFSRLNNSLGAAPVVPTPTPGPGSTRVSPADGMRMVFVPAGEFVMGSVYFESNEMPSHTVFLDAFWIDQTEVTNAMFAKFVEATGYVTDAEKRGSSSEINFQSPTEDIFGPVGALSWSHPEGVNSTISGRENHPVIHISWNDAREYCTWAGRRLPTEAEWEKAASWNEGTEVKTTYPWGNELPTAQVNLCDQNCEIEQHMEPDIDDGYARTSPVGSFPGGASPYGALDMAGNAAEWVADWFGEDYYSKSPSSNPAGPEKGEIRVIRGGTWYTDAYWVRTGIRIGFTPDQSSYGTGIRCASSQ